MTIEIQNIPTRSVTGNAKKEFYCPIFGEPRNSLQINYQLECALGCCFEERYNLSRVINNGKLNFSTVVSTVAKQIKYLYYKESNLFLVNCRIVKLINV